MLRNKFLASEPKEQQYSGCCVPSSVLHMKQIPDRVRLWFTGRMSRILPLEDHCTPAVQREADPPCCWPQGWKRDRGKRDMGGESTEIALSDYR